MEEECGWIERQIWVQLPTWLVCFAYAVLFSGDLITFVFSLFSILGFNSFIYFYFYFYVTERLGHFPICIMLIECCVRPTKALSLLRYCFCFPFLFGYLVAFFILCKQLGWGFRFFREVGLVMLQWLITEGHLESGYCLLFVLSFLVVWALSVIRWLKCTDYGYDFFFLGTQTRHLCTGLWLQGEVSNLLSVEL